MEPHILVKKLHEHAKLPVYSTVDAAGCDLHASLTDSLTIEPGNSVLVPTGLCFEIPAGYEAQIRPRSGLALKNGITVLNSPGTVDFGYRGEIGVILINHSNIPFVVNNGDRIAQAVFAKFEHVTFEVVAELASSERGAGGFGSTGIKS